MRPRRLTLEGFGPYKHRQELDFTQLDLFAICGPTGAGKSSIVDALTYALYGRIYRVGDDVKSFISLDQATPRMMVALEFEANGSIYRVVRATGVKTPAQTQLEELRGGEWHPLEGKVKEANERIQRIIGLDFDAFTKSVVLPQNEFHRFLSGKPEERRKILDQLLSLEIFVSLHKRANQLASECQYQASLIHHELETTYADATAGHLENVRRELKEAKKHLTASEKNADALKHGHGLATALRQAAQTKKKAEEDRDEAQSHVSKLEVELKEGANSLAPLQQKIQDLQRELDATPYDAAEHQRLIKAEHVASSLEQALADERTWAEQVRKGKAKLADDEAAEAEAKRALDEAEARVEAARAALEEARRHDMAATLRSGLQPGDSCPVCGQTVGPLPETEAAHLDVAQRALADAEAAAKKAHSAYAAAAAGTAGTREKLEGARGQLDKARERAARERDNLAKLIGEEWAHESGLLQSLQAKLSNLEKMRDKQASLKEQLTDAKDALNEREKRLAAVEGQLAEAQKSLALAESALDSATAAFDEARATMSEWIGAAKRSDLSSLLEAGADLAGPIAVELEKAQNELKDLQIRIATLELEEKAVQAKIEQAKERHMRERELSARQRLAEELAYHLRADRLPAFIREEALRALAADGSERLSFLSGGRYTFEVDKQEFLVVDQWNGGDKRSVKTLSGGETFLASLALALALAERIPELAAGQDTKLESLFLDEGFGALDAETLDVAARALDALHSEERLVGVITHIDELADRLPARVRVIKEPEGSRLEVV